MRDNMLRDEISLTAKEWAELEKNSTEYSETVDQLLKEIEHSNRLRNQNSRLDTRSAALNYEIYETYMAIHTNAIKISGQRALFKLKDLELLGDLKKEVDDLLEKYLIIQIPED